MSGPNQHTWVEANQRYLVAAIAEVKRALARRTQPESPAFGEESLPEPSPPEWDADGSFPAIETVCRTFSLSPFERAILLLCAGVEMDSSFSKLCADVSGDPLCTFPTFSLALASLPQAHWSALSAERPLRRWKLVEMLPSSTLVGARLRIDESVLHFLAGLPYADPSLAGTIEDMESPGELTPSQSAVMERMTSLWTPAEESRGPTVVNLCGNDIAAKSAVVASAAASVGLSVVRLHAGNIPAAASERAALARMVERMAYLSRCAVMIDAEETEDTLARQAILPFIESVHALLVLTSREPVRSGAVPFARFDVDKPTAAEQATVWRDALQGAAQFQNGTIGQIVSQYNLNAATIRSISSRLPAKRMPADEAEAGRMVWDACRAATRPRLDELARRITPSAEWDDLVLPENRKSMLRDIARFVRRRFAVHEEWGFAKKSTRGLAISALFSGGSGVGKTMAAEVLANELRLDLYHIDLSQVVSKYIGETEKNIRRLFDAAEDGGAILFFDEADALFGKRSEVKDSHDRYANIEVSYLLQRIESYRGLVVLATNMKESLDAAFVRRIQFFVHFPFPDAAARAEIWKRVFPAGAPVSEFDHAKLAGFSVAGGNIRNIALYAAFLAADAGEPIAMRHIIDGVRAEYAKLERPFTDAEARGLR